MALGTGWPPGRLAVHELIYAEVQVAATPNVERSLNTCVVRQVLARKSGLAGAVGSSNEKTPGIFGTSFRTRLPTSACHLFLDRFPNRIADGVLRSEQQHFDERPRGRRAWMELLRPLAANARNSSPCSWSLTASCASASESCVWTRDHTARSLRLRDAMTLYLRWRRRS